MEGKKSNILYIDDEYYNLTAFVAAFRRYYNIYTSDTGRHALTLLQQNDMDLIITDQRMPDMTGTEFLEAIIPEYPHPIRMILTGFSDIDAIRRAINSGAVLHYITKPWDEKELKQIIDMGISTHKLDEDERLLMKQLEDEIAQQNKVIEQMKKHIPEELLHENTKTHLSEMTDASESRMLTTLFLCLPLLNKFVSESDAKKTIDIINLYFAKMIKCVSENHGAVYQIMGENLIATFGAATTNETSETNEKNAISCALAMQEAIKKLPPLLKNPPADAMTFNIGISSGKAIMGRVVTSDFLSEVVMGDAVNRAEKMLIVNQPHNEILLDEPTYTALKNEINAELLTENDEIKAYRLLG